MIPKIETAIAAVENGVHVAAILDGRIPRCAAARTFHRTWRGHVDRSRSVNRLAFVLLLFHLATEFLGILAMEDSRLQHMIDTAWENRESLSPRSGGEARDAVEAALAALDSGRLRVAEKRDDSGRPPLAEKSGSAFFPAQRHGRDRRWTGRRCLVGQSRFQIQGMGRDRVRAAGFRAVPGAVCGTPHISQRAWC